MTVVRGRADAAQPGAWPGRATPVAHPARLFADTVVMESVRRQPPRALPFAVRAAALACVLAAALLLALVLAPPSRAAAYGDGAAIPFLLLPADNPWNTPVDSLPLDPNSADYIAHMSPATGLHPDFGTVWEGARIGIPYIVVPGTQPKVPIHFTAYGAESDPGPYPVPSNAPVEGTGGPYEDGDRHVLVLDADHQMLYELYHAYRQADGSWNADSGAVFDLTTNALRPDGWTSADAAGLPILPGLARYDEIVGEGVLDHALRFTVADTQRAYVYPATHFASDSEDADLPPMGLRVRLRADFDVSGFPPVRPDDPEGPEEVRDDGRRQRRRLVRGRRAGRALGRRRAARAGGRDRRRLRGRRLARAAARRLLRQPAGDGDGARGRALDARRRVLRRGRRALDGDRGLRRGRRRRAAGAAARRRGPERRLLSGPPVARRRAPLRRGRRHERAGAHGDGDGGRSPCATSRPWSPAART